MHKSYRLGLFIVAIALFAMIYAVNRKEHDAKLAPVKLLQTTEQLDVKESQYLPETAHTRSGNTNEQSAKSTDPQPNTSEIYKVAKLAFSCRNIPANENELADWIDSANQNNELPRLIESVTSRYENCVNVDRNTSYVDLLLEASKKGSDDAIDILWFLNNKDLIQGLGLESLSRDELVEQLTNFTVEKYEITEKTALLGGEKSMLRLIQGYRQFDPATQGQSFEKSLAYTYLLLETTSDDDNYRRADWFKASLQKRMTLDEISHATVLADELLLKYQKDY